MRVERFKEITKAYGHLRIIVLGDFCLDRYLEIDSERREKSIETGLPVFNVTNVRAQPGAAGTVLNNLVALGIGTVYPIGFRGMDGEGMELEQAMRGLSEVCLVGFMSTHQRRTFTYTKPLLIPKDAPPKELNRLDFKNWTPTPARVRSHMIDALHSLARKADAIIVLDQVDIPETGVVTRDVLEALGELRRKNSRLLILADCRRGLCDYPSLAFKMNSEELARMLRRPRPRGVHGMKKAAYDLAARNGQPVFVTLAERGMVGALPSGETAHLAAFPVRGPIDIVGAGDAVTANIAAAMAGGAGLQEAMELASAAASVVIHKLGTTGTASLREIRKVLENVNNGK